MKLLTKLVLATVLCLKISAATTVALQDVMARLDNAAAEFRGMTAKIERVTHTAVINEDSREAGTISMRRPKPRSVQMLIQLTEPDLKTVSFRDRKLQIYYPKISTVQEYDLGKQGQLLDQFLLLGFGTSGKDLAASYTIKLLGEEAVAGKKSVKLELTPKSNEVREHLKKVEIWIAETTAYPVQQKLYQTSGDTVVITYSDLKVNPALTDDHLRLKLPKGVKKEYPQR